jgi:hypothetical protein
MKLERPHVVERTKKIQEKFDRIHKKGESKSPFIIKTLAKEFFLSPRTVEDIVYRTGVYGDKVPKKSKEFENQLDLFQTDDNNG